MQAHLRHATAPTRAALLRNELGYLLRAQGDSAAARPYYERALAIREQVLGARPSRYAQLARQPGGH